MKHQTRPKLPTIPSKGPPKDKPLHKKLRFALVVLVCLFGQHLSVVSYDQIVENVGTTTPALQAGRLMYVANLKRTDTTIPGVFVYNEFGASMSQQTLRFFDSAPIANFLHSSTVSIGTAGKLEAMVYIPSINLLLCNNTVDGGANNLMLLVGLGYSTGNEDFALSYTNAGNGGNPIYSPLRSSDSKSRFMERDGATISILSSWYSFKEGVKTTSFETANKEYIDQVTKIGNYALYMHRLGHILWDDETVNNNAIDGNIQTISDFQPKYAVGDFSRPCTADNCDIVVFQERDNSVNHLSILSVKIANAPVAPVGSLKFTSLDVSAFATVNMPVVMPNMNAVAIAGSTTFYLYNILDDKFEQNTDFDPPPFAGMVKGSLKPGEFDLAMYPDQRPFMAVFADGSNFKARMFVLSTSRCKSRDGSQVCTACKEGYGLNSLKSCDLCDFTHCAVQGANCECTKCNPGAGKTPGTQKCHPCEQGEVAYLDACYPCNGITNRALQTWEGSIRCAERDTYTNSGWGPDTTISDVLFLKECSLQGCQKCKTSYLTCTDCNVGKVFHLNKCTTCGSTAPAAILVTEGAPQCVDLTSSLYAEGFRQDLTVSTFYLLEPCAVPNCKTCPSAALQCESCKASFTLSNNACTPTEKPNPSGPAEKPNPPVPTEKPNPSGPTEKPNPSKPTSPSFMSVSTNSLGLAFGADQSRNIQTVEVYDVDSKSNLSCEQVGCKYSWKGSLLRISFTPSVTVTNGNLMIHRQQSQTSAVSDSVQSRNRLLQTLDNSVIMIPNIKLTQTPGYMGWVTTGQVVLFLLRTVGSVLIFPKYPKLAMVPDLLITMSFILCAFLGPVILTADSAFEVVGQVKILWFRMDGVFEDWDSDTLSLSTAPNSWKYPIFCSFLDNYSQNTIGLLALALVLTIVGYLARRVLQNKQPSPRMLAIAANIEKHYGTKFLLAKVYANSLEILLYSLISFDKADASSKSIIGIMLAAVFVGVQVWLAVGATLTSISQTDPSTQAESAQPYESRPDTVLMTEPSHVTSSSPSQVTTTEKVARALTFGWQQIQSTNLKKVSRSKAFLDTAFFLRNLGICLVILKLVSSAQAQLIVALFLQLCYLCYFIYCNIYRQKIEFVALLSLEVMMFTVIFFKLLSTIESISESNLQNTLGLLLLLILAVSIILATGSYGLGLAWNWRTEETKALQPASFKTCIPAKPNSSGYGSSPAHQTPANLKIIIGEIPIASPRKEELEQSISMQSIPDEARNPQLPTEAELEKGYSMQSIPDEAMSPPKPACSVLDTKQKHA